jgi:YHS domain-containing protein
VNKTAACLFLAPPTKRWARMMARAAHGIAGLGLVLALASGTAAAQGTDAPHAGPFRTNSEGADDKLMLEGHDAVAYFSDNAAVKGDANIKAEHLGVTYRFRSEANRAEFLKNPSRYMPQFGGFCSNGINYAIPWGGGGGPNTWRIYRGKLYVFGGQNSRDEFEMDTETNLRLAHQYWRDEVAGSVAWFTRYKRLVFRVPHYKTGAQLREEYAAKLAAKTLPVMPGAAQVVPAQ